MGESIWRIALVAMSLELAATGEATAGPSEWRYHLVSLDAALPAGFDFYFPSVVTDDGRVYGACGGAGTGGKWDCDVTNAMPPRDFRGTVDRLTRIEEVVATSSTV